jgi:hypothetical protein
VLEDLLFVLFTHLAVFWLGYRWGLHSAVIRIISNYLRNPGDMQKAFKQITDLQVTEDQSHSVTVAVRAEWVADQVYLYREDTQEFLAQGADVHSALTNITRLTPGVSYEIPADMAKKPEQT